MFVETMLPFGKADSGLKTSDGAIDISRYGADAARVEALGFDGLCIQENKDDPYVLAALALAATSRITACTSVAIAFPRSPAVTAMAAWSLARLSGGRFVLGLGSQVKGHIERRFGMQWKAPGPWMRDYLQAVRDHWDAWQAGRPVRHESASYRINLNVPVFTPAPLECPPIKLHLAAVNPYMCQVAGELADGVRVHPVCTAHYLEAVMLPAIREGATKAGRRLDGFAVGIKPLVATGPDEATVLHKKEEIRGRIAFYGSTPAYAAPFEAHGLGDLAAGLNALSKAQRWAEMPALVSDEVLERYAVVAPYATVAQRLRERFGHLATHCEFSIPLGNEADLVQLGHMLRELKGAEAGVG